MREKIIDIKGLVVKYFTDDGTVEAINDVDLYINKGETLGLVGETGAGKTTTALSIIRLLQTPPGEIVGGSIHFNNKDITQLREEEMRNMRGKNISMIFQDPMTSLNPVLTILEQIAEVIKNHQKITMAEALTKAEDMLELVGIPRDRAYEYPHQFSGGMKQRVVIAIALACQPELLIADEPTSALDVTIQAQVLEMMEDLKKELDTSVLLITHDLGVVAETCDRVAIMYAGEIVETGNLHDIYKTTKHPYTLGLFGSIPSLSDSGDEEFLKPIKGLIPDPTNLPTGCKFHTRCPFAEEVCREKNPKQTAISDSHSVKCLIYEDQLSIKEAK